MGASPLVPILLPWNARFSKELKEESSFAPREAIGEKDARTLARDILAMSDEDFRTAFKGSPCPLCPSRLRIALHLAAAPA